MSNQDGWDQAKDERIEAALQRDEASFAPHCPECLSDNIEVDQMGRLVFYDCRNCACTFQASEVIYLHLLAPQPAPPYTDGELITMAYAYGHDLWGA